MDEYYDERFPLDLSSEEKAALMWKIEQDYISSNLRAISFKDEYVTFAINFYIRNPYSLEDVTAQYRAHCNTERRKNLAKAFMEDMKSRLRKQDDEMTM